MRGPVVETSIAFGLVALVCLGIARLGDAIGIAGVVHLGIAATFLGAAIRGAERRPGGLPAAGIALGGLLLPPADPDTAGPFGLLDLGRTLIRGIGPAVRELGVAVGLALLVFPPFYFGFVAWFGLEGRLALAGPANPASFAATQLLLVALPEEAFFRGYVQSRLGDAFPRPRRVPGTTLDVRAWLLQSTFFALVHFLVEPHPARLAVFFPGLLFGWIRARRDGIGAAVFFHAFCNIYSDVLARSVS